MNIYKKWFLKTILSIILFLIFYIFLSLLLGKLLIGKNYFETLDSATNHKWYSTKIISAKNIKTSKIVFVSGSNTLFGIKTIDIEKSIKKTVINFGVHAGLKKHIFYSAKKILKPNDIVILSLEYPFYINEKYSSTFFEQIINYDKQFYDTLPIKEKYLVCTYLQKLILKKYTKIGSRTIKFVNDNNLKENTYYNFKINKNGDIETGNYYSKIKNTQTIPKTEIIINKQELYKQYAIIDFISWCKKNNIKVYAIAPNIYHTQKLSSIENKSFKEVQDFYKHYNVKFLGTLQDGFYSIEDMLDTNYHLNNFGRIKRTKYLISVLKTELNIK